MNRHHLIRDLRLWLVPLLFHIKTLASQGTGKPVRFASMASPGKRCSRCSSLVRSRRCPDRVRMPLFPLAMRHQAAKLGLTLVELPA